MKTEEFLTDKLDVLVEGDEASRLAVLEEIRGLTREERLEWGYLLHYLCHRRCDLFEGPPPLEEAEIRAAGDILDIFPELVNTPSTLSLTTPLSDAFIGLLRGQPRLQGRKSEDFF